MGHDVPYLRRIAIDDEDVGDVERFPFSLPFVRGLDLTFARPVTFFVGENGSGKSTVMEAIAEVCGLPVSGGGRSDVGGRHGPQEESSLGSVIRPYFGRRPRDSYFFRGEFHAHFASLLDERKADPAFAAHDPYARYGGRSLHGMSHGEAFLSVILNRMEEGLFLLDEPESALSPQRQLVLLARMSQLVGGGRTQFVVATHSPILLTFPGAQIISMDEVPPAPVALEDTSHFQITKSILEAPELYWRHLAGDETE